MTPADHYDANAVSFAQLAKEAPNWVYLNKPLLHELLKPMVGPAVRVVDLGAGCGRVEEEVLIPLGVTPEQIVAFERSTGQLSQVSARVAPCFRRADITKDLDAMRACGGFDLAICNMVFDHLSIDDVRMVSRNSFELLRGRGRFVVIYTHPAKMMDQSGRPARFDAPHHSTAPWSSEPLLLWRHRTGLVVSALEDAGFLVDALRSHPFPTVPPEPEASSPAFFEAAHKYGSYPAVRLSICCSRLR